MGDYLRNVPILSEMLRKIIQSPPLDYIVPGITAVSQRPIQNIHGITTTMYSICFDLATDLGCSPDWLDFELRRLLPSFAARILK